MIATASWGPGRSLPQIFPFAPAGREEVAGLSTPKPPSRSVANRDWKEPPGPRSSLPAPVWQLAVVGVSVAVAIHQRRAFVLPQELCQQPERRAFALRQELWQKLCAERAANSGRQPRSAFELAGTPLQLQELAPLAKACWRKKEASNWNASSRAAFALLQLDS